MKVLELVVQLDRDVSADRINDVCHALAERIVDKPGESSDRPQFTGVGFIWRPLSRGDH